MNQEDKLIFDIFKNFDQEFDNYKKNKMGKIKMLFESKKLSPSYLKIETDNPKKNKEGFGEKKGNMLHGFVVVKYGTLNYYIGNYQNNEKNGFGYHHFINKLVYKGKYTDGKKVGGIVIDPEDGHLVYEGGWANDTYNGKGTLTRKNK